MTRSVKPLSDDQKLRAAGFRIRSRRVGEQAMWERKNRLYNQTMALAIVARDGIQRVNE